MAKSSKLVIDKKYLKQFCNLKPDRLDPRDHRSMAFGVALGAPSLPKKVDYSKETGPVGNQGYTGSCVGWATAYGLRRWMHKKKTGTKKEFSVRFVWMASKEIDRFDINVPFDLSGTMIRDAFKVMRKFGACPDSLWKFSQPLPHPDKEEPIKTDAMQYRIGNYTELTNNDERRFHLAKKGPFVVGVPVFDNWDGIGSNGLVPDPGGNFNGGHAVLVVGYDNKKKLFKFQNSWSKNWGAKGYGYFTYDYMSLYSWKSWGAEPI